MLCEISLCYLLTFRRYRIISKKKQISPTVRQKNTIHSYVPNHLRVFVRRLRTIFAMFSLTPSDRNIIMVPSTEILVVSNTQFRKFRLTQPNCFLCVWLGGIVFSIFKLQTILDLKSTITSHWYNHYLAHHYTTDGTNLK